MRLFVYGSLRRDVDGHHHPLMRPARFIGPVTVAGRLYKVTWHPGLKLEPADTRVTGELFEFGDDVRDAAMAALHEYEGDGFRLVPIRVRLGDGRELDVNTYEWLGDAGAATIMPEGDWGPHSGHPAA